MSQYHALDEDDGDVIDYDQVTELAKAGLKNPRMIAHTLGLPVKWFTDTYKEKVDLAIERGLAYLILDTTAQVKKSAKQGDFAAQKYILQNMDDTWSDRKEIKNTTEIDIKGLPTLTDLFQKGLEDIPKIISDNSNDSIEGEFTEE